MKEFSLKKMSTSKAEIIDIMNNKDYKVIINRLEKDDYKVIIIKRKQPCFICKAQTNKFDMEIRQDKRVPRLFTPKLICKSCIKSVDKLIDSLKIVQPRHLKELTQ
jgi:hypothetical protein|tara:strand:+ start:4281 stop:4598 length:318 start_codon:yes stop_codon:yes gene_type:complete